MSDNLLRFNEMFPNSKYREIHAQVSSDNKQEYQSSKSPINDKILTFDQIKDTKNRVGWIVPNDYIVIDLDSKKDASIVYEILSKSKCNFSFMSSKHGGHFIFKNPKKYGQGVKTYTSIGLKVDTRCLEKGYIILPHNDTDRQWGEITNIIDDLPFFLAPLKGLKSCADFVSMEIGSRNQELFKHFLNLKDYCPEITLEEKVKSIKIINNFVLRERLDDLELENTVLRTELVEKPAKKPKVQKRKISLEEYAEMILENKQIITSTDVTYIYNGKYYKELPDQELERMIHEQVAKELEKRHRKEIIEFIKLKTWINPNQLNKNWNEIVVKNGILNLSTLTLYPHTSLKYNTIYIDYNYNDKVNYSNIIDEFFNTISNRDHIKKQLFYEIIGYCFLQKNILQKFFLCFGAGGTGKSTFLEIIAELIGDYNTSYLGLTEIEQNYMSAEMFGKLVNIGDDISQKGLKETSTFKKMVSGERINARRIYGAPFTYSNFATIIFTANRLPKIDDRTTGLYRRMLIIDVNNVITKPDPLFKEKITEIDYEYLLYKSAEAVNNVIKNQSFVKCPSSEIHLEAYKKEQSSALTFIDDMKYTEDKLNLMPTRELYEEYKEYCIACGYKPFNKVNFQNDICDNLKVVIANTTRDGVDQKWRFKKK